MLLDPENHVVKLCIKGMDLEGEGKNNEAGNIFNKAWEQAVNDFEKLTAAHYLARHQNTVTDKLKWDEIALNLALTITDEDIKATLPSLYLNVAKCYEDLQQFDKALLNYNLALSNTNFLPQDGYGNMIKAGINNGISRVAKFTTR